MNNSYEDYLTVTNDGLPGINLGFYSEIYANTSNIGELSTKNVTKGTIGISVGTIALLALAPVPGIVGIIVFG